MTGVTVKQNIRLSQCMYIFLSIISNHMKLILKSVL